MNEPTQCVLWRQPERVDGGPLERQFALLETFVHETHWWRYLLACRECGQRYVFEFYEEVDWAGGEDPQFCTWIPVSTEEEVKAVREAPHSGLGGFVPRLCKDWPKDATSARIYWVKRSG